MRNTTGGTFTALQEVELLSVDISKKLDIPVDSVILNGASLSFAYHTASKSRALHGRD